jgi:hypothetical protein
VSRHLPKLDKEILADHEALGDAIDKVLLKSMSMSPDGTRTFASKKPRTSGQASQPRS